MVSLRIIMMHIIILQVLINQSSPCDYIEQLYVTEETDSHTQTIMDVTNKLNQKIDKLLRPIKPNEIYLTDKQKSRPFSLENGNLIISERVDREEICKEPNQERKHCCKDFCCMFVGVSWLNKRNSIYRKSVYIRIDIRDINDNRPKFPTTEITKSINENTKVNTQLSLPIATDDDMLENSHIIYQLKQDPVCSSCFKVIKDKKRQPILIILRNIDREHYQKGFRLQLLAIDNGKTKQNTGTLTINIKVKDMNDNPPIFDQSKILLKLPENKKISQTIQHLNVKDRDIGVNSDLNYEIEDFSNIAQQYFKLLPTKSGVDIQLQMSLDYEKHKLIEFSIVATDNGASSLSSTATVTVEVRNVNDHKPVIRFYELGVQKDLNSPPITKPENGPREDTIILVHVTDVDSQLSDIQCSVYQPRGAFFLKGIMNNDPIVKQSVYELKNTMEFNREEKSQYNIGIQCTDDSSISKLTTKANIQLRITDVNDCKPTFSLSHYVGVISETNRINQKVMFKDGPIKVTDLDEGINSELSFRLQNLNNSIDASYFIINSNLQILNKISLDYEVKKEYKMLIVATDGGRKKQLSSSVLLTIKVRDINDNRPKFMKSFYEFSVKEEMPIGTVVGELKATDADSLFRNRNFIYEIDNPYFNNMPQFKDPKQLLMIDKFGKIKTKAKIDREKVNLLSFPVSVRNSNKLITDSIMNSDNYVETTTVNIKIEDINDHRPRLVKKTDLGGTEEYNYNERPLIVINKEISYHSNVCALFPFKFVDDDADLNAEVKISLKKDQFFKLDGNHGLICPISQNIRPRFYTIHVIGEDRNGQNGSLRAEYPVKVQVISPTPKRRKVPSNPTRRPQQETTGIDKKTIVIFIGLIATIIVFFILLALVIIKSKICLPRYTNNEPRKSEQLNRDRAISPNNAWNKSIYKGVNDQMTENKRLWINNNYDAQSGLLFSQTTNNTNQTQLQNNMDPIGSPMLQSDNAIWNSHSCDNLPVMFCSTQPLHPHQQSGPHYEHIIQNPMKPNSTTLPINTSNATQQQQQQQHLYNYLIDTMNTNNNPNTNNNLNDDTPNTNKDNNIINTSSLKYKTLTNNNTDISGTNNNNANNNTNNKNQKSINDVYLQTSFV